VLSNHPGEGGVVVLTLISITVIGSYTITHVILLFMSGSLSFCNDPTIGSYNHYHLSPNGIPSGNHRWYGLVYLVYIAGKPRIRPRE